jgi:hypothetical protein
MESGPSMRSFERHLSRALMVFDAVRMEEILEMPTVVVEFVHS